MFLWTNKKNIFFCCFVVVFSYLLSAQGDLEDDFDEGLNTIFLLVFFCVCVFVFVFLIYFI